MNTKPIELAKDADLRGAIAALHRAEAQAVRIARQTGTRLIKVATIGGSKNLSEPQTVSK